MTRCKLRLETLHVGDGIVVGGEGKGHFNGFLAIGDMPNSWFDNGYRNPQGAEIHIVINDHGPLIPDMAENMLNSYRGGCTDASLPPPFPATAKADGKPGPNTCPVGASRHIPTKPEAVTLRAFVAMSTQAYGRNNLDY